QGNYAREDELQILQELVGYSDPKKILKYSERLIERAIALDSAKALFEGYLNKGYALALTSDYSQALENYFKAATIAEKENLTPNLGIVNSYIADVYSKRGNHDNAVNYYKLALNNLRAEKDSVKLAGVLANLGDEYLLYNMPDSALLYFNETERILKKLDFNEKRYLGILAGNRGIAYHMLGRSDSARYLIVEAVSQLELIDNYNQIPTYLNVLSEISLAEGNRAAALNYARKSLDIAEKFGLKDEISDANLKLAEVYESSGNYNKAFYHFRNYSLYKDSVQNIESVQKLANLRIDFEIAQNQLEADAEIARKRLEADAEIARKQLEVDAVNKQKENQTIIVIMTAIASTLMGILAIGLYRRNRFIQHTKEIIESEKGRSDKLLRNILPDETAEELKEYGKVKARRFESVSVLFADFKGFTMISEKMSPEELVTSVDNFFSKFDEIIERHGVEKIKTMGDAYMCVCGLPFP
ncbi:MAG: adenylate/guanylate cyclase domain-containing protein, partial [Cyclobacteriaceae bacterium]